MKKNSERTANEIHDQLEEITIEDLRGVTGGDLQVEMVPSGGGGNQTSSGGSGSASNGPGAGHGSN